MNRKSILQLTLTGGLVAFELATGASDQRSSYAYLAHDPTERCPLALVHNARREHEFYFARVGYSGGAIQGFYAWQTDYPKADLQLLEGLRRLTKLDVFPGDYPVHLTDARLGEFPFLYAVEVGHMALRNCEVERLRRYLLAGGFLMVDDFWGTEEWNLFEWNMRRVLPEYEIRDIPLTHPIFHAVFDIRELVQIPNVAQANGFMTWEKDGYEPFVRGIFDERGRLMVLIVWNCDLGDAWEWVDKPDFPLRMSTYAYQLAANAVVYAMTH